MKKVFVTVCAVAFAAAAAHAQGWGTVRDINSFGKEYAQPSKTAQKRENRQVGSLEKEIARQTIAHYRKLAAQEVTLAQNTVTGKQNKATRTAKKTTPAAKPAQNTTHYVVYTGRSGKALALADAYASRNTPKEESTRGPQKNAGNARQDNTQDSNYYVYTGREGKMLALVDACGDRRRNEEKAEAKPAAQNPAKQTVKKEKKDEGSWWSVIFGGRYPGESDEDYADRLALRGHAATQPFK